MKVLSMTKKEITQLIYQETQKFSVEALQEILNFIQSIKQLNKAAICTSKRQMIKNELNMLNKSSVIHLIEEFDDYEETQQIVDLNRKKEFPKKDPKDIQRILNDAKGAWGKNKTLEEIDLEINNMRTEWDREWM